MATSYDLDTDYLGQSVLNQLKADIKVELLKDLDPIIDRAVTSLAEFYKTKAFEDPRDFNRKFTVVLVDERKKERPY